MCVVQFSHDMYQLRTHTHTHLMYMKLKIIERNDVFYFKIRTSCLCYKTPDTVLTKYDRLHQMADKHDRFFYADQEPRRMLQPIEGYQNMPPASLKKSVEQIVSYCPDIQRRAYIAMSNCQHPLDWINAEWIRLNSPLHDGMGTKERVSLLCS